MFRQFTASLYILQSDKALLLFHPKLKKWLPPGGHLEPNELPHECALREAKEETGYECSLLTTEKVWVVEKNAMSIPSPYLMLKENIPMFGNEMQHEHIDLVYIARAVKKIHKSHEKHEIKWIEKKDLPQLVKKGELFQETAHVLEQILASFKDNPLLTQP